MSYYPSGLCSACFVANCKRPRGPCPCPRLFLCNKCLLAESKASTIMVSAMCSLGVASRGEMDAMAAICIARGMLAIAAMTETTRAPNAAQLPSARTLRRPPHPTRS